MKIFIILACLLVVAKCSDKKEWEEYKKAHGKAYKTAVEDEFRQKIYLDRKNKIEIHNEMYENKLTTYKMGINRFTDMTELEVTEMMTGYQPLKQKGNGLQYVPKDISVPDTMDWRQSGYVTDVKDQGQCGACWAFSVTGGLEGQHKAYSGNLVSLSEQQMVDCGTSYGLGGCEGGNNEVAFSYVILNGGIDSEDSYPFEAVDGSCRYNPSNVACTSSAYVMGPSGDENGLKEAVGSVGPISVGIDAEGSFQSYSGGVYYEPNCNPDARNHAVVVVGYGNEDGSDYWLVKNSWGTGWGESGYIKMARNHGNNCGISSDASWPIVP